MEVKIYIPQVLGVHRELADAELDPFLLRLLRETLHAHESVSVRWMELEVHGKWPRVAASPELTTIATSYVVLRDSAFVWKLL